MWDTFAIWDAQRFWNRIGALTRISRKKVNWWPFDLSALLCSACTQLSSKYGEKFTLYDSRSYLRTGPIACHWDKAFRPAFVARIAATSCRRSICACNRDLASPLAAERQPAWQNTQPVSLIVWHQSAGTRNRCCEWLQRNYFLCLQDPLIVGISLGKNTLVVFCLISWW